jgi:glutathione synthase/RimK-type ligase-like ATP-grasp enzyme
MANKDFRHIGTVEQIAIPKFGYGDIPAKIDTGADGSSIWASYISIEDGKLTYKLFAPGSIYYKDELHTTTTYRVTTVKNSFGDKEFRYKVRLTIKIGDIQITRWFALANRSRNTYPILLGKNFLRNKFVVDVAKKHLLSEGEREHKIIIFSQYKKENEKFFKEVSKKNKLSISYDCIDYKELAFYIDGENTRIVNINNNEDIANYSYTYFKNHHQHQLAFTVAEYLSYKNRPFADHEFLNSMSASKLSEYMKLSRYGVTVPTTLCAQTPYLRKNFAEIKKLLGLPFVLKEFKSDRGKFNYLINSKEDFIKILDSAPKDHIYIAQQYIPNNGFYRIYVMGKEAGLAVWRSAVDRNDKLKAHLNKPRGSANAENVPLSQVPGEAEDLAVRAANCLDRQIAGVDIVQDINNGKWYVLEANNDPQIRTGSFVEEKAKMVAKYFERELNQ